jgi:hypothetical protein
MLSGVSSAQLYFNDLPSLKPNSSVDGAVEFRGNCFEVILTVLCALAGRSERTKRGILDVGRNGLKLAERLVRYVVFMVSKRKGESYFKSCYGGEEVD